MKTTRGRDIKKLEVMVDGAGWSWEVQDGKEEEMLSAEDIAKVNKALVKKGVKVNKTTLQYPNAQVLCG